jgi:hypothetical protein
MHIILQPPQVAGLVRSVSQPSSGLVEQWPNPLAQPAGWIAHAPAVHCTAGARALRFTFGKALQSWLHEPQFLGSVSLLVQLVPHTSGEVPLQEGRHMADAPCWAHKGVAPLHTSVQLPQLVGAARSASQPSFGLVEQWPCPGVQALAGPTQAPERHSMPIAPGFTFGRVVQSWPQAPQFFGSDALSTQLALHASGAGATQLETQLAEPLAAAQSPVGAVQECPQEPQFATLERKASQPSSGREVQWP